jgi:predicted HTH domain antitoxin
MGRAAKMQSQHDTRTEAALYWTAVSLIVCEGLSIEKAAERLGVDPEDLTDILHRRQSLRPPGPAHSLGSPAVSTHS